MEDSKIIELFFERSERAIVELSEKYGSVCMKIAFNVLGSREDSEECVNDSYLGMWNAIPPEKPNPLLAYLLRIVKNLSIKRSQYNSAQKRSNIFTACFDDFDWCISDGDLTESEFDARQISCYIDEFLDSINQTNRMLFVRRYWYMDSFEDIAATAGMNEAAVRKRLSRIRADLKNFLKERGVAP